MTVLIAPPVEQKWALDANGNWVQRPRVRFREGNGYREIKVVDFSRLDAALAQLNREHAEGRVGETPISAPMFSDREVI